MIWLFWYNGGFSGKSDVSKHHQPLLEGHEKILAIHTKRNFHGIWTQKKQQKNSPKCTPNYVWVSCCCWDLLFLYINDSPHPLVSANIPGSWWLCRNLDLRATHRQQKQLLPEIQWEVISTLMNELKIMIHDGLMINVLKFWNIVQKTVELHFLHSALWWQLMPVVFSCFLEMLHLYWHQMGACSFREDHATEAPRV